MYPVLSYKNQFQGYIQQALFERSVSPFHVPVNNKEYCTKQRMQFCLNYMSLREYDR